MTPSDELTRLLAVAADDIVGRGAVSGPDSAALWGRGRRVTWAARAAAGGLVVALAALVVALALVARPVPSTMPATGPGPASFPTFVSDLFPGIHSPGPNPVFAIVGSTSGNAATYAIDRGGHLSRVPTTSPEVRDGALSPDGLHVLLAPDAQDQRDESGIVDLTDGSIVRPLRTDDVLSTRRGDLGVWSPDSQHVLIDTPRGPVALDLFAGVDRPSPSGEDGTSSSDTCDRFAADDPAVLAAGWRDADTLLAVGRPGARCGAGLVILERGLGGSEWTKTGDVDLGPGSDQPDLDRVAASPDGSRLLLEFAGAVDSDGGTTILVDSRTGGRVAFAGASEADAVPVVSWDGCAPVWRADQPLLASGGLRRPADGTVVLEVAARQDYGCVVVAGAELTGSPDPSSAARWRERAWQVLLPVGGVLALAGAVWMLVALRRSRRHGERFLPMIYVQRF